MEEDIFNYDPFAANPSPTDNEALATPTPSVTSLDGVCLFSETRRAARKIQIIHIDGKRNVSVTETATSVAATCLEGAPDRVEFREVTGVPFQIKGMETEESRSVLRPDTLSISVQLLFDSPNIIEWIGSECIPPGFKSPGTMSLQFEDHAGQNGSIVATIEHNVLVLPDDFLPSCSFPVTIHGVCTW